VELDIDVREATSEHRRLYSIGAVAKVGSRIVDIDTLMTNLSIIKMVKQRDGRTLASKPGGMIAPANLTDDQAEAFRAIASSNGVFALVGGPGTGKSTLIREIRRAVAGERVVAVTATTNKAADALRQSGVSSVQTVQSFICRKGGFGVDLVIVDESSMLDSETLKDLLYSTVANVLLVGDVNQLPPVGMGSPFRDLINAGRIEAFRLTTSKRNNDHVAALANRVLSGELTREDVSSYYDKGAARVADMILCYTNRGVDQMNEEYSGKPPMYIVTAGGGDYFTSQIVTKRPVGVPYKPAHAITVHRSQGSEWPHVHINLDAPYSRELLYTAVTRASKRVSFGGIVRHALKTKTCATKTALSELLAGAKVERRTQDIEDATGIVEE
jgi:ATP-dependent exoDNAse (exonuclease V) alpha subunit